MSSTRLGLNHQTSLSKKMSAGLLLSVSDLIGHPGEERSFSGEEPVQIRLGQTTIETPMKVKGRVVGMADSVMAGFSVSGNARFVCVRCLVEWEGTVSADAEILFGVVPDEDGYPVVEGHIDLTDPAQAELALALPAVPLCRKDCKGLCPNCGSDLNDDPCDGHEDDSGSPFAVLKDLFDS